MRRHAVISPVPRLLASLLLACLACSATVQLHGQTVTYTGTSPALNFGSVNVCPSGATSPAPCSATLTLTYNVTASGTLGTPKVVTVGAPNLDYTLASGSTCVGAVAQGNTCAVNVTLAPRYAGQRKGAVQIVDGSGKVLATTLIYGIGVAPQIAFDPATQTTVAATPFGSNSASLAVDELGYVYVEDFSNGVLRKFSTDGGGSTTVGMVFDPFGISLDGAGDIFLENDFEVFELPAGGDGDQISVPITGPSYLDVAVDGAGDVFTLNYTFDSTQSDPIYSVAELPAGGGPQIAIPFPGFAISAEPRALTLDSLGNVFVADVLNNGQGPSGVYKLPAGGGSQVILQPTLAGVGRLAADAADDVFIGDFPQIVQLPAGAAATIPISAFPNAVPVFRGEVQNVAVSSAGDVFSVLPSLNLVELHRSQPPALTFHPTPIGSTSQPLSVQIQNIGNATLSLSGLSVSEAFALVPGTGTPADCTASSSLAPGARCNLSVTFTPSAEDATTGAVTLSDNTLNNSPATQIIQLSGSIGDPPQAQLSATTLSFGHIAYPNGMTLPLKITNIGGGTLTVSPSINGPSYTISASTCGAGVAAGNSCTLQVTYAPVAIGYHDDTLTVQTNGYTTPTAALQALATGVGALETETTLQFGIVYIGSPEILPLTIYNYGVAGSVNLNTKINGPSYAIVGNTCAGVTAGGTCTLQVQFNPNSEGYHNDILTLTPSGGAASTTINLKGNAEYDYGGECGCCF
jgi:hypothetical protein